MPRRTAAVWRPRCRRPGRPLQAPSCQPVDAVSPHCPVPADLRAARPQLLLACDGPDRARHDRGANDLAGPFRTTVTVKGQNLIGVTSVRFGTRAATNMRVSSSTAL